MVSLFNSLNIATNALAVNESAISVVSHNVANMNTEGYSKQRVNLASRNIAGVIGDNVESQVRANGGVMIENVKRYNDSYLNNYYRDQLSKLREYEQQADGLGELAEIFNDLNGNGIDTALQSFYESLNNLNEYPASSTARINFVETSKSLTSILNTKYEQLAELTSKALGDGASEIALENSKIYTQYSALNDQLDNLAAINKALQLTQTGTLEANNLLDKRDIILNNISEYVDIHIDEKPNGSVNLYVGDTLMVKGATVVGELDVETAKSYCDRNGILYPDEWVDIYGNKKAAAVVNIVQVDSDGKKTMVVEYANDQIQGGSLGGMLHSTDLDSDDINVGKIQECLNNLAETIAEVFNDLNTRDGAYSINPYDTGKLVATTSTNYLFVNSEGTTTGINAGNIKVNDIFYTDNGCWKIACAYFDDTTNFDELAVGNSQNVVDMLGTRSKGLMELDGMTIEDYYSAIVGKVAAAGANANSVVDAQQDVVDSIANQISANNSVDLNEELVDLVKYQTAYAASAQVFNKANECLDVLMTLGG